MELILLLLSFLLLSSTTSNASDPVLDSDGDELQRGKLYYVQSVFSGSLAGGLRLESLNGSCPLYVTKSWPWDLDGQPLEFLPENGNNDTVLEERTLNIKFAVSPKCRESTMWKYELSTNYVRTGGTRSDGTDPNYSRFAIFKAKGPGFGFGYQIQLCPCILGSGRLGRTTCLLPCFGELGVVGGEVTRVLGVNSNSPLTVNFVKVEKGGVASSVLRYKA